MPLRFIYCPVQYRRLQAVVPVGKYIGRYGNPVPDDAFDRETPKVDRRLDIFNRDTSGRVSCRPW